MKLEIESFKRKEIPLVRTILFYYKWSFIEKNFRISVFSLFFLILIKACMTLIIEDKLIELISSFNKRKFTWKQMLHLINLTLCFSIS